MNRCPSNQIEVEATCRFRTRYLCRVQAHHTVEDVMSPEYFGQLINARGFQEMDMIEVEWEDGTKWGLLQIRAVERALQLVVTKARIEITDDDVGDDLPSGWSMAFHSASAGWIIKQGDTAVEGGFPTPERARNRIAFLATQNNQRAAVANASRRRSKEVAA